MFADAGLPVILSGGDPHYYVTGDGSDRPKFEHAITSLKKLSKVYTTADGKLADKLASLDLDPHVRVHTNGTWYTTWRESIKEKMHFVLVLNDGSASMGYIEVRSRRRPYFYDLWTGKAKPVLDHQQTNGTTLITLTLQANQTIMIGFREEVSAGSTSMAYNAYQMPPNVVGYEHSTTSRAVDLHISAGEHDFLGPLSPAKKILTSLDPAVAPFFALSNWSLTVEHWDAPTDVFDASQIATKYNTTHQLGSGSLASWTNISILANVSGLGYYSTSFDWDTTKSPADGAYVIFPRILHALRLYVNGQRTSPIDYNNPKIDIGPYLKSGPNKILAVVPSTMWNYLRSIFDQLVMSGYPPLIAVASPGPLPGLVDNGLVGTVYVVPYIRARIGA
jgi:hypothetical protein